MARELVMRVEAHRRDARVAEMAQRVDAFSAVSLVSAISALKVSSPNSSPELALKRVIDLIGTLHLSSI